MQVRFKGWCLLGMLSMLAAARTPAAEELSLNKFAHKIAYIKDGEVWVVSPGGPVHEQLTATDGQVATYLFSPDLNYLAYAKIIEHVAKPGIWKKPVTAPEIADDLADVREPPTRPVTSVVIMHLADHRILKEINPPKDNWLLLKRWLPGNFLLYIGASGFDVWGHFVYDPRQNVQKKLFDYHGYRLIYGYRLDFDQSGSTLVYVDDAGSGETFKQNLHLLDIESQKNEVVAARQNIQTPVLSRNKQRIAFVEREFRNEDIQNHIWMYDIPHARLTKICTADIRINPEAGLAWSLDDRYLLLVGQNQAVIVEVERPSRTWPLAGRDFHWMDNQRVLYCEDKDILAFAPGDGSKDRLVVNASHPAFLLKRE